MPRADYHCPREDGGCGHRVDDHVFSMRLGAVADAPLCPYCTALVQSDHSDRPGVRMVWIPAARFDLKGDGDGDKGFQKFTVHRQQPTKIADGTYALQHVEETIDSLSKVRKIERESEQRYRDGEGEPLRFRAYAQGASNTDVGAFGASGTIGGRAYDSGAAPTKKKNIGVTRHGTTKPTVGVARGAGRSSLGG